MKTHILHLSDIHIKEKENENPILKRDVKIFDSIKNELIDAEVIFIIVTGDIAFSGQKSEFEFATHFLSSVQKNIANYTKKPCNIITIPGNHDCNFKPSSVRDHVLHSFDESGFVNVDEEVIETCCKPQENYHQWITEVNEKNDKLSYLKDHKLIQIIEYKNDNYNIIFNCYNTAWVSKKVEEYGKMVFPFSYFNEIIFNNQSNLTINLIHHPFNWQAQHHYREFRTHLQQTGDIVLSGHEHEKGMHINFDEDGSFTGYVEAGALQDSKNRNHSSFNLIKFDLKEEAYKLLRYGLKNDKYQKETESEWIKYFHRYNLSKKEFVLKNNFKEELINPGAPFIHAEYGEISNLHDIYIFPDVRTTPDDAVNTTIKFPDIINSQELLVVAEKIRYIFIGEESSGKTALCKQLFSYYYDNNFVPILLNGEDINEIDKEKFRKKLKKSFGEQYDKKCIEKFDTLDNKKILLIIDDFHKCPVKHEYRWKLVSHIKEVYDHIIFTGNSHMFFQPLFTKDKGYLHVFEDFSQFTLLEFNIELRNELINKWNRLGRDDFDSLNLVTQKNVWSENQIKIFLTSNLLPSYPINILTLLQAMEIGGKAENIFGNSYDLLIGNAISKNISKKDEHDFYNQLLTDYCYFLFDNKFKEIETGDFNKYIDEVAKNKSISIAAHDVLKTLTKAKLINEREGFVSIANRYVYYYYVARYLSQNFSSPDVKSIISRIAKRVYREEFYNVMIFLTHFSKESFITEELFKNANELFKQIPITKLEEDISLINQYGGSLPKLVLEAMHSDEKKKEIDKERADLEESEKDFYIEKKNSYDLDEDITTIDFLNKLILAIKTFEILGQVTQKSWGSSSGTDKYRFTEATFNLALRTLNFYFQTLIGNKDGIIEYIKIIAGKKKLKEIEDIKTISTKVLFHFAYLASFGIIKRISNSIGHPQLENTFAEIIHNNPATSYKLIDVSIKLDHFQSFPFKEIEDMFRDGKFNTNYLPKYLVQNFVYNHLRMYHTTIQKKQKICDLVEIDVKSQITAEITSKEKK